MLKIEDIERCARKLAEEQARQQKEKFEVANQLRAKQREQEALFQKMTPRLVQRALQEHPHRFHPLKRVMSLYFDAVIKDFRDRYLLGAKLFKYDRYDQLYGRGPNIYHHDLVVLEDPGLSNAFVINVIGIDTLTRRHQVQSQEINPQIKLFVDERISGDLGELLSIDCMHLDAETDFQEMEVVHYGEMFLPWNRKYGFTSDYGFMLKDTSQALPLTEIQKDPKPLQRMLAAVLLKGFIS